MQDYNEPVNGIFIRVSQLVEDQSQADRQFFDKHSRRLHRVRLAHAAEIAQNETVFNQAAALPEGNAWYVAVRRVAKGVRLRAIFSAPIGRETSSLTEKQAAQIYEVTSGEFGKAAREIEDKLREVVR